MVEARAGPCALGYVGGKPTTLRGNVSGASRPHSLAMCRGKLTTRLSNVLDLKVFRFKLGCLLELRYTVFEGLLELRYAGNDKYERWAAATYTCRRAS